MMWAASGLRAIAFLIVFTVQWSAVAADDGPPRPLPVRTAVINFELIDLSLEGASYGVNPAETRRLTLISNLLRDQLDSSGRYKVIDLAPAAAKIADAGLIHSCNGCEVAIARSLGADSVIAGTVQKVSTLILSLEITERDVSTSKILSFSTAQIRGNTDQSWSRGVKWLVRNRLLARQ